MSDLTPERQRAGSFLDLGATVWLLAAIKLGVHLYAGRHYGYFVDELYYLACGDHLDWGYVDQPPLIALVVKLVGLTIGTSLPALRLLPALAGAAEVLFDRRDRAGIRRWPVRARLRRTNRSGGAGDRRGGRFSIHEQF